MRIIVLMIKCNLLKIICKNIDYTILCYDIVYTSVYIAQMRRQRPGWDGCRDRVDGI